MISQVRNVVDLLSSYLGVLNNKFPIIRKEQSSLKPQYPFGAYKLLSVSGSRYSDRIEINNPDPTKMTEKFSKIETAVVSLSFYIRENTVNVGVPSLPVIDVIYDLAERAIDFLQKKGKDHFHALGVVVELFDTNITDRTVYLDPIYEYQIGFDFKVRAVKNLELTIDAIDVDATFAGIEYVIE